MRFVVPVDLDEERADLVVARLSGASRMRSRAVVDSGTVTVDGAVVTAKQRVAAGAVVEFEMPDVDTALRPEAVAFDVIYEDEHLAVVDKPAGVITHPGAGRTSGTLAAGILHRWPRVRGVGDDERWGIVHRLDKETSGLLVVALTRDAFVALRGAVKNHLIERTYLALVKGVPSAPTGTIDAPIGADPRHRGKRKVDSAGRPARTHYRVLGSGRGMSLLEVSLETGRTHQIRVHLAAVGLPVAGDRTYGSSAGSPRQFLHATRLAFDHPITGRRIEAEAPLPADLAAAVTATGISVG